LFRKAAEQGDAYALYNLGWAYESGLGVSKDRQQAMAWYSKAAEKGNLLALRRLDSLSANSSAWSAVVHIMGF
jgi:TPR repeat protein